MTTEIDRTDRRLIGALRAHPRSSIKELADAAGIARGTVYSRLDRLERTGVITGYGPDVDHAAAGFGVLGFCTLEIAQGSHAETMAGLSTIPQILEIHTITGPGDLLLKVVAMSNDDLHDILQRITALKTVRRSQTQLALHSTHTGTVAELVADG